MGKGLYTAQGQMDGMKVVTLGLGDKLQAKIAPKQGNNLFSLCAGSTDVIDYDSRKPLADFLTGTPVLFPFPNRVEDAMWQWNGKHYLQKKNGAPVWLHSLVCDETTWEYDQPCVTDDGALLKTRLKVDKNHPVYRGYPFCFTLAIDYLLAEDGICISYSVENQSDEPMPYGFALHPYFKRMGKTTITVPAEKTYERRDDIDPLFLNKAAGEFVMIPNILPTGRLVDVRGTKYELNAPREVNAMDLDDVYTQLTGDALVHYEDEGLTVRMITTEDIAHMVVYTPPGESFFCIEPQTCCTDAINLFARGIKHTNLLTAQPGEIRGGQIRLKLERG